jgi:hypothetical protein
MCDIRLNTITADMVYDPFRTPKIVSSISTLILNHSTLINVSPALISLT